MQLPEVVTVVKVLHATVESAWAGGAKRSIATADKINMVPAMMIRDWTKDRFLVNDILMAIVSFTPCQNACIASKPMHFVGQIGYIKR